MDFIFIIYINKYMYVSKWFIFMMISDVEYIISLRLNWWKSWKLFFYLINGFYGLGYGYILNLYLNYFYFFVLYWEVCYGCLC